MTQNYVVVVLNGKMDAVLVSELPANFDTANKLFQVYAENANEAMERYESKHVDPVCRPNRLQFGLTG
jgi:hypothetical protein